MNDRFSPAIVGSWPDGERRRAAAEAALALGSPNTETEEWRYSPVGELVIERYAPRTDRPDVTGSDLSEVTERAATVRLVDGWPVEVVLDPGWEAKGLEIVIDEQPQRQPDGDERTLFDLLHEAWSPAAVVVRAPPGLTVRDPVVIVDHHGAGGTAAFGHLIVDAADGSDVTVVELQTSADGDGLSVPVVELVAGPAARIRHQTVQELGRGLWQLARQRSVIGTQATVVSGLAAFGGRYARRRTDSHLAGRGGTSQMSAAYYGDGDQIHDFRVFQHHDARDTRSDLLFKGAQDGASGAIYTGMIHIHGDGAGSNAFQTNRNVKLGPDAWAWSVPNLEIENSDVHCSHASTVSPVDEDQRFYLHSRGVPPVTADRLIVAGFFDEVIARLPVPALAARVRAQVAAKLDGRNG